MSLDNEITEANPQCWAGIIVFRLSTTFQFDLQDIREIFNFNVRGSGIMEIFLKLFS